MNRPLLKIHVVIARNSPKTIHMTDKIATHPFPDDEVPGIVVGVLKSVKNRCLGSAGKLGEPAHLTTKSTHHSFSNCREISRRTTISSSAPIMVFKSCTQATGMSAQYICNAFPR